MSEPVINRAAVLTVSDSRAGKPSEDLSGPAVTELLSALGIEVGETAILPDDREQITQKVRGWIDRFSLIVTTGALCALGLGSCVNDLLFFVAPFLT